MYCYRGHQRRPVWAISRWIRKAIRTAKEGPARCRAAARGAALRVEGRSLGLGPRRIQAEIRTHCGRQPTTTAVMFRHGLGNEYGKLTEGTMGPTCSYHLGYSQTSTSSQS